MTWEIYENLIQGEVIKSKKKKREKRFSFTVGNSSAL